MNSEGSSPPRAAFHLGARRYTHTVLLPRSHQKRRLVESDSQGDDGVHRRRACRTRARPSTRTGHYLAYQPHSGHMFRRCVPPPCSPRKLPSPALRWRPLLHLLAVLWKDRFPKNSIPDAACTPPARFLDEQSSVKGVVGIVGDRGKMGNAPTILACDSIVVLVFLALREQIRAPRRATLRREVTAGRKRTRFSR